MSVNPCLALSRRGGLEAAKHGVSSLPVDVHRLARDLDIEVVPVNPPPDISRPLGCLVKGLDRFEIIYDTSFQNEGLERFSIAHELGHYFLPGHLDAVFSGRGRHESCSGFTSKDKYEREADCFAAGLLMPESLFKNAMRTAGEGLLAIETLADSCQTSLVATAIRFVQLSDDPLAVVVSEKGRIDYCFMSETLAGFSRLSWLKKGEQVPKGTITSDFIQDPANVRSSQRDKGESSLADWFGYPREEEVTEEVIGLGRYRKILTVLTVPGLPDLEEIEEEDRLVESWKPRF